MSYKPPFTISPRIIDLVSSISESLGRFDLQLSNSSPELRRGNRIKTITGTLAIEGNSLTEEQITAVLDGKKVLGSVRELAEVQGAIAVYEMLSDFDPFSIDDLKRAHAVMMENIMSDAGSFRKRAVGVSKGEDVIHIAPQANMVSGLISDLLCWAKNCDYHPLITGAVFHYEFEFIHPFTDGNGRMGRLWQTLMLSKWKKIFLSLPLENVIKENQQEYYDVLRRADNTGDSTCFVEFILQSIYKSILENAPTNAPANAPTNKVNIKTPDAIVKIISQNSHITRKEIADAIGKDIRTVSRAIKKLQDAGKIKRVGATKNGYWEISC